MLDARHCYRLGVFIAVLALAAVGAGLAVALAAVDIRGGDASVDAILTACSRMTSSVATVGPLLVLILAGVSVAVLARSGRSAWRQLRARRRFLRGVSPTAELRHGPFTASLIDDERRLAFCTGYRRPRVFLSTGTRAALRDRELEAVLAHEAHHAARRDPLRLLVVRVLGDGLFFLPVVRHMRRRYAELAEVAADAAAVRHCGDRGALAGALLQMGQPAGPEVVGIAPERVDHLLGECTAARELPRVLLLGGLVTVGALVALVAGTAQAAPAGSVDLPMLLMGACAVAITAVPAVLAAGFLLKARALRRRQQSPARAI
jgi:Zn-dependent protease with chaperone function